MSDNPHSPCPYVECGSSDAFNWNDDGYGHCHSCSRAYPMKNMPQTFDWVKQEYILKERIQPQNVPVTGVKYTGIRSIDPDVCQLYGIQIQTGSNGEEVRYAYKYPHTIKYRMCNDKSKEKQDDKSKFLNEPDKYSDVNFKMFEESSKTKNNDFSVVTDDNQSTKDIVPNLNEKKFSNPL